MKIRSGSLVALAAASLLPLGAFAADTASQSTASEQKAVQSDAAKAKKDAGGCEGSTATRIRRSRDECGRDSQPVTRYSKQDLESTGQFDTAEALKRLDPRFH